MFGDIARKYFLNEGVFYLDLWPMSGLFLTVISPTTAISVTQTNPKLSMERPHLLERFFKPIAGGPNLFDLHESQWRPWRAVFAKGFSEQHIFSLVPGIVKETKVYMETLRGLARKGEMFSLDTTTLRFTMDMIGRTILYVLPAFSCIGRAKNTSTDRHNKAILNWERKEAIMLSQTAC
jgi:hypothetical protein